MPKKKRRVRRKFLKAVPEGLIIGLDQAQSLMNRKRWLEARTALEELDRRYPNRPEVLTDLVNVNYELNDIHHYQWACARLLKVEPNDPEITLALAGSYLLNFRPALSLRTFRQFLERWPDHERADEVRQNVASIEEKMDELLSELGEAGEEGLEIAAMHEEVQSALEQGDYTQGRKVAEKLLVRRPDLIPVLNNLSLIYFAEGELDQAIATAERVLNLAPENYHALSNLTRYLYLSGHTDEAEQRAGQLKALKSDAEDASVKKAEALGYMGDDEGVLEVFKEAEQAGRSEAPLLYHLAAVAALRLGREDEARRHWREALKLSPGFDPAKENMDDLRQPVGERHAPWAFTFGNWVPRKAIGDLLRLVGPAARGSDEKALQRATQRFLDQHPEIARLVPILLDRGDKEAREFAMRVALMVKTPEMLAALRDFSLGQRGPDKMRMEAANAASSAGLLPAGTVRLWMQGKWQDLMLIGYEIYTEAETKYRPRVADLLTEGSIALQEGDAEGAERLLKGALELEPDAPEIMNNLALAYEKQGRSEEAISLVREAHRRHPDYLFARVGLARKYIAEGELDQAEALLQPLISQKRFHISEYNGMCNAQIKLFVAQKNPEAARSWLDVWAAVDPDHSAINRSHTH